MKIFCIGRNYAEHAKELNNEVPEKPLIFSKPQTAILNRNRDFYYPDFSNDIEYEAELIIKIGKNGKNFKPKFAKNYIKEFTVGLDLTARDLQTELKAKGHPWDIAKGFDGSAIIGEFIPYEGQNFEDMNFSLNKNGEEVQKGHCKDMIFKVEEILSYLSGYFTLLNGDLIFTGTPKGVGPLSIGDYYEGFIGDKKLFHTQIK